MIIPDLLCAICLSSMCGPRATVLLLLCIRSRPLPLAVTNAPGPPESIACRRRAPATAFTSDTHIGSLHLGCGPYAYITINKNSPTAVAMQHSYIPPRLPLRIYAIPHRHPPPSRDSVRAAACMHGEGPPANVRLLLHTETRPLPSLRPMRPGLQAAAQADDMRPRRPLDAIKCYVAGPTPERVHQIVDLLRNRGVDRHNRRAFGSRRVLDAFGMRPLIK